MSVDNPRPILAGKKALVVGIANQDSIAYGCAKAFREVGADIAITYLNEKARPHVAPLDKELGAPIFAPLDVAKPGELEALFARIEKEWGQLDILVHSIASAKKEDIKGGTPEENAAIKVAKINIDEQPQLASQYGVMSIPTLLVFENGDVIEKAVGARNKSFILQMLEG